MSENINKKKSLIFNDSLADLTEWTSFSWSGHQFQDYAGEKTSSSSYEFKTTKALNSYTKRLPVFLIILGVFLFISSLSVGLDPVLTFLFLGFLPIFGVGAAYWYNKLLHRPFIFDTRIGYYWKGNISPEDAQDISKIRTCVKIKDIHALQILRNRVKKILGSYLCYELNLVLKDGSRQLVLNHADLIKMQEDAAELAAFLGLPVWDNTIK